MSQKRCLYCQEIFTPHPRKGNKQETCGKKECRKKRKRETDRKWRASKPEWEQERHGRVRAWAKEYPDYWKGYRANPKHFQYVQENRRQTKERMRARRQMFAKQDVIRTDPIGSLKAIQSMRWQKAFAKQDVIRRQLDGLLGHLIAKECLQNQPV